MKLTTKKVSAFTFWLAATITTLGIAGLFLSGGFMGTFLGFLPLMVHQIVGWVIIASVAIGAFAKLAK